MNRAVYSVLCSLAVMAVTASPPAAAAPPPPRDVLEGEVVYPTDENHIPVREAFKWSATDAAPGQALWYRRPGERYWDQRYARDHDGFSVEEEDGKPGSLLNHYRALSALRAAHPALVRGAQRVLAAPAGMLAVERQVDGERLVIIANLTGRTAEVPALAGEGPDLISGTRAALRPWQTALYRLAR